MGACAMGVDDLAHCSKYARTPPVGSFVGHMIAIVGSIVLPLFGAY